MLLNTRFYVDKALTRQIFADMVSCWLTSSSNYALPAIACDFKSDEYVFESEDKSQKLTFNNYEERFIAQLVVDSNGATYTTTFVLDDVSEQPSLHLSQNKVFTVMSTDSDKKQIVNLPNIVKNIFWEEYGGDDNGILTDNKPLLLRKSSAQFAADILSHKTQYLNPIVYVSPNNQSGLPDLDCEKVAQELMGQAHVVVENSPMVADKVKSLLSDDDLQPYNGAVRVIFPSGDSKLFNRDKGNSFDYSVINSVRRIMANVSIEDGFNASKIRQRHLMDKLANSEDKELVAMCEQMLSDKDAEMNDLKKEIDNLKQQLYASSAKADSLQDSFDKNIDSSDKNVQLSVAGAEMYEGEALTVILKVLQKEYDSMTGDPNITASRKYDILGDVLEHNFPCDTDTKLIEYIEGAFKDGALTREGIGSLKSAGFAVEKGSRSSHYKIYYKGFEKYFTTVSSTPSDKSRGAKNAISYFCNTLFGF